MNNYSITDHVSSELENTDLSGTLTWDKWTQWHKRPSNFRAPRHLKPDFEEISKSDFLIKNFLQLPEQVQKQTAILIMSHAHAIDVGEILQLRVKMQSTVPLLTDKIGLQISSWVDVSNSVALYTIKDQFDADSNRRFDAVMQDFLDSNQTSKGVAMVSWDSFLELAAYLLTARFSADRVTEVMIAWTKNATPRSVGDFIFLTENWETAREYPFDWSLSLTNETHES